MKILILLSTMYGILFWCLPMIVRAIYHLYVPCATAMPF